MCGIAGILAGGGPVPDGLLGAMLEAQRHRGPQGAGTWVSGPLALGSARLAVLDPSPAAAQPMRTADGRFALAYNGEVYNAPELRRELARQGEHFASTGDTEVVLKALARDGEAALARFNGVFALAFWDARERRLLLARDRLGVRPLYWAESGGHLLFASEIKALLASGLVRPALDGAALAELFRFQNIWSPRTLFAGVHPLEPGAVLRVSGGRRTVSAGWRFDFPADLRIGEAEALEALEARLGAAVARQLAADVSVGCALSGGTDAAAVASEAVRRRPGLPTFTVGYDVPAGPGERAADERAAAAAVARALGTEHHEVRLDADEALAGLEGLMRALEEPRLAFSYQNLAAARLARSKAVVVLSGGGGDELFAGYAWRYRPLLGAEDPAAFRVAFSGVWSKVMGPGGGTAFWTAEGLRLTGAGDPEGVLASLVAEAGDVPPLSRALSVEARTFLPAYCVLEDKLHMAEGLEIRLPFLDHDLVDWARRLPGALLLSPDAARGKLLLRRLLASRLPPGAAETPKQGFVAPLMGWWRRPPWRPFLETALMEGLAGRGLIRPAALRRDLDALGAGDAAPLQRVWTCLGLELWCRAFLD